MRLGKLGLKLIKDFEGCELKVYKDAIGLPTIGYGHLIKNGEKFTTITLEAAEQLLKEDVRQFEDGVLKLVKAPLTQNQFDALVSFSFNLGLANLSKSTLLLKINSGKFDEAALEFVKWNKAGGKVLAGLTRRREAEKKLFLTK